MVFGVAYGPGAGARIGEINSRMPFPTATCLSASRVIARTGRKGED